MKTIEQAATEYAERNTLNAGADRTKRENAFKAGIEFSQQWISIDDELPSLMQNLLLKLENGLYACFNADLIKNFKVKNYKYLYEGIKVTHWRLIELK